eukprot:GEMP01086003.1.p2 GENE.GEMP01086003.1~~GEMP01086003.1.p2  ORF type:complete len:103 (+),score=19.89 GEMP01086003.1:89-397(+)
MFDYHLVCFIHKEDTASVPLCMDLNNQVLQDSESCFSTCGMGGCQHGCPSRVLAPGLAFEKDKTCKSHVECVGRPFRVLCQATSAEHMLQRKLAMMAQRSFL